MSSNKNARVRTRRDRNGKVRTETSRRDSGALDIAITTNERGSRSRLFIDLNGRAGQVPYADVDLTGHEIRTLCLVLQKHLRATNRSILAT